MKQKRILSIIKDREEFYARLEIQKWQESEEYAAFLRLMALIQFSPEKSNRQILNHARINCK